MTKPKNKIEPNERLSREDTVADLLEVTKTVNTPPLNHRANVPTVEINDTEQRKTPKLLNEKEERAKLKLHVDRIKKESSLQISSDHKNTLVWKDKNGDLFTNLSTEINTEVECSDVLESFYFDRPDLIIRIIGQLHHDGSNVCDHQEFPDLEYCLSYTGKGGVHLLPGELQRRVINLVNDTGAWIVTSYEDHDVLESARQPYVMPVKVEPEFFPEASVWPPSYTYSALHLANEQTKTKTEGLKPDSPYECILVSDCDRKDLDNLLKIVNKSEVAVVILKGSGYITDTLSDAVSMSDDAEGFNKVISKLNKSPKDATKIQKEHLEKLCQKAVVFEQKLTQPDMGIGDAISDALLKVKPRKITLLKLFVYLDAFDLAEKYIFQSCSKVEKCYYSVIQLAYIHKRLKFIDFFLRKGVFSEIQKDELAMTSVITDSTTLHFNEILQHGSSFSMRFIKHHKLWLDSNVDNSDFYGICDHLFRQCLVSEDFKMSLLFWLKVQDPLGSLLMAYSYLKRAAQREHNNLKKKELTSASQEYQDLAVTFVNACYERDPETTLKMITRKMERFNDESCIDLAMSSKNLDFLEQPACVTVQRRVWNWGYLWEHYADNMKKLDTIEVESVSQKSKMNVWRLFKKDWLRYLQSLFAPVTMFSLNGVGLLIFIYVFALTLLGRLEQSTFHWLEGYLLANVVILFMEEINEIHDTKGSRWLYLASGWNQVDILSIGLFIIGAAVRVIAFFYSTSTFLFDLARIALCVDFIVFTLRLLHNCYSNQVLGPTCSMIIKTVSVLMKFLYILAVFWVSYAVASEAILYPNSVLNSYTIFYLLRKAYWQMFGQLFLDEMDAGKTTDPNSLSCTDDKNLYATYLELRCPTSLGRYFAPILMAVYMMFVNILLFNLITATFTKSIEKIQVQASKLWRFQFFELTRDFSSTLFLTLPFTPVSLFARFINESKESEDGFSMYPGKPSHKTMKKETHVNFKVLETSLRNKWLDENRTKSGIQEVVAKTLELLEFKVNKQFKDKVIEHISPEILEVVKLIFNEIEKYLIKEKIIQDVQKQLKLDSLQGFSDTLLTKLKVILQETELKKLNGLINDSDELWNIEYDGLLGEIFNFKQEKYILQEIVNKIDELNRFDWKLTDEVHVNETQKSVTKTLKDMEEIIKKLKLIKLPHKTKLEDRRGQRIRGITRRIKDLINLMSDIPVQSYTYNRFYAQLQKKIQGLISVVSSLKFVYIRDEFMNDINDLTQILSTESKTKEYLETEAKIKDLEIHVLQNHIEPKIQKKNLEALDRTTKSGEKNKDLLEVYDLLNPIESKIQKKNLEPKDAIESDPSTDSEKPEDDLSDIIWVPMFSDSEVKINSDDSTTFVHEPENVTTITFNNIDKKQNIDRRSYSGKYDLENGKPVNPLWNQTAEGDDFNLKRWGPNHYGVVVITRIKHKGNKIVRKDSKVELEFLVRKKKSISKPYELPQVPCSPNQDPFTEFMRPKAAYVKKVLKSRGDSLKNMNLLLLAYKALRGFRMATENSVEKSFSIDTKKTENKPTSSPLKSTKTSSNSDSNKPKIPPKTTSKTWNTIRSWFHKTKRPEPISNVRKSQLQVKDCQKTKTVFIGIDEENMSKHKWKEIRVINYHNPNAENQSKLETDLDLEWVDSTKYKEIKDIMKKDIVKVICGLHDAYTERRSNSAMLIKQFR